MKIRSDALIGESLKRTKVLQEKGLLSNDKFQVQGVGARAARIALVVAANKATDVKGATNTLVLETYTLPNGVKTFRLTITVDSASKGGVASPPAPFDTQWNVCVPRENQTFRTSCFALDHKLDELGVDQTLKLNGAGRAIEVLLVFMNHVQQEYGEDCCMTHHILYNKSSKNPKTGRFNKLTFMEVWLTKMRDWSKDGEEEGAGEEDKVLTEKDDFENVD